MIQFLTGLSFADPAHEPSDQLRLPFGKVILLFFHEVIIVIIHVSCDTSLQLTVGAVFDLMTFGDAEVIKLIGVLIVIAVVDLTVISVAENVLTAFSIVPFDTGVGCACDNKATVSHSVDSSVSSA